VTVAVTTVLLLGAQERLHSLARRIPLSEFSTLGKFLVLTGVMLPILPREPVTRFTDITPYAVWLAVVVVATLSYGSYLLQRFTSTKRAVLWSASLGGLYSSTATTVVLSRRARQTLGGRHELHAGILLATSLMYLRVGIVVAVFHLALARSLAPYLAGLSAVGLVLTGLLLRGRAASEPDAPAPEAPRNPLELSAALIFAVLFVVISVVSPWCRAQFGHAGVFALAAIVGVTDIDPFVLSIAQGSVREMPLPIMMAAILVAASTNDLLKALYAGGFAGWRRSLAPMLALTLLAGLGLAAAGWLAAGVP
jgi:uncharacterized membrane protein (DUF4010 family)